MGEKIIALKQHLLEKNKDTAIQEMKQKKLEQYEPDFKVFVQFCEEAQVALNFDSALLFYTI